MNFGGIAPIAVGITSILGLIGFIVYGVLFSLNRSSHSLLSVDLINALKTSNENLDKLKQLSAAKLKIYLESRTSISQDLIEKGIAKEVSHKGRIILVISVLMLILSFVFGFMWLLKPAGNFIYGGVVYDDSSLLPVTNAVVAIIDRPDIKPERTDANGYFSFNINQQHFRLGVTHPGYQSTELNLTLSTSRTSDSLAMGRNVQMSYKVLYGNVFNQGKPLPGVIVQMIGRKLFDTTNKAGHFEIIVSDKDLPIRLQVYKDGFEPWNDYINVDLCPLRIDIKKL